MILAGGGALLRGTRDLARRSYRHPGHRRRRSDVVRRDRDRSACDSVALRARTWAPRFGFGEGFSSDRPRRYDTRTRVGALTRLQVVRECIDVLGLRLDVRAPLYRPRATLGRTRQRNDVLGRCTDLRSMQTPRRLALIVAHRDQPASWPEAAPTFETGDVYEMSAHSLVLFVLAPA
jgi:hypothetical protein